MSKKTNIYERLEDLHIRATVLYVKSNDSYLYADIDRTEKVTADEVTNLFVKGLVLLYNGDYAIPVSLTDATGYVALNIVTTSSNNAVAVTPYYSAEYTAS